MAGAILGDTPAQWLYRLIFSWGGIIFLVAVALAIVFIVRRG